MTQGKTPVLPDADAQRRRPTVSGGKVGWMINDEVLDWVVKIEIIRELDLEQKFSDKK